MSIKIKPREATAIINSLSGGVVPRVGIQHITVGRRKEINAMLKALSEVENGHSIVKFWIGAFGSGKSFMLHLLNTVAMKKNSSCLMQILHLRKDFMPMTERL